MTRLVLGSRNKKKLKEMLALLGDLPLDLTDLTPYPGAPEVEETAETFVGNATLKAAQLAPVLGAWVVGEDSGLCVPALGGAPGVYSARYSGAHGDDPANNEKLLREMAALTGEQLSLIHIFSALSAALSSCFTSSLVDLTLARSGSVNQCHDQREQKQTAQEPHNNPRF